MSKKKTGQASEKKASKASDLTVVGIGASAGGLEALQEFISAIPESPEMAFVVIQHLSPDYKSLMSELLARHTKMKIEVAQDGVSIQKSTVYLIPPRNNLRIFHDKLFLEEQDTKRALNLPIDIFFKSLAEEKQNRAIGVILSGTGSDGTLGIKSIKDKGGMVIAQNTASAKFDGMPRSAIETGLVDFVLEASDMPEEIIAYSDHPIIKRRRNLDEAVKKETDKLSKIVLILRDYCGIDFSFYKENTIIRRIERRVSINRADTLQDYINYLLDSDNEKEILYKELLIGVTRFFRDPEAFDAIAKEVVPKVVSKDKDQIRIWSAGCSTGEEVYTLAILFKEYISKLNADVELKIFATDIDRQSLDTASQAVYPDGIFADMDPEILSKYFTKREDGYQANDEIRRMVVFAKHNLLKDPPFSRLDLIVCRNLFIYIKPDMQAHLINMFFHSLKDKAYLMLGTSEAIGDHSEAFIPVNARQKIYQKNSDYKPNMSENLMFNQHRMSDEKKVRLHETPASSTNVERLLDKTISQFLPPSVIIDSNDNIVHIINDINPVARLKTGNYSRDLYSILPKELGLYVSSLIRQLRRNNKDVFYRNISGISELAGLVVDLEARIIQLGKISYTIVLFHIHDQKLGESKDDGSQVYEASGNVDDTRIEQLEDELQTTKESLQATVEELETSNEELQSSNEELIASNEELQSTNEELQSVNEELYTVNSEYQAKIEELTSLKSDVENLLRNTEVGALYLDGKLQIRKITDKASEITNVRTHDLGRPINHIAVMDGYPGLVADCENVLENLVSVEREIKTSDRRVYLARVRPYRTQNNAVDGILLTFVDITELKKSQRKAETANRRLIDSLDMGRIAWWEWDYPSGEVIYHKSKATMLGYTVEEFPDDVYEICELIHPDDYEQTMQVMKDHLSGKTKQWEATYRIKGKDGDYRWYHDKGKITIRDEKGKPVKITGVVSDVTELELLTAQMKRKGRLLELILENSPLATTMVDASGQIVYANKTAEKLFNVSHKEIMSRSFDASKWKISDEKGNPIDPDDLPFGQVKATGEQIEDYRHFIQVPGKKKTLISVSGAPVFVDDQFKGGVFIVSEVGEVKADKNK